MKSRQSRSAKLEPLEKTVNTIRVQESGKDQTVAINSDN